MQQTTETAKRIRTSYGYSATIDGRPTGFLAGSGYGKDHKLQTWADRAAVLIAGMFPRFTVTKRGNSSGMDSAALIDLRDKDGHTHCLKLGAFYPCRAAVKSNHHSPLIYSKHVRFDAMFQIRRDDPHARTDFPDLSEWGYVYEWNRLYISVNQSFLTLTAAHAWLQKWTDKYPPTGLTQRAEL